MHDIFLLSLMLKRFHKIKYYMILNINQFLFSYLKFFLAMTHYYLNFKLSPKQTLTNVKYYFWIKKWFNQIHWTQGFPWSKAQSHNPWAYQQNDHSWVPLTHHNYQTFSRYSIDQNCYNHILSLLTINLKNLYSEVTRSWDY